MPSRLSAPSCRNEGGAPESRSRDARGFSGELRPREEGSGASVPRLVQSGEATVHEPTSPADGRLPRRIRSRNPGTRSPTAKSWGLPPCSWVRPEGDCIPAASLRPVLRRFSSLPRKTATGLPGDSSFCCPLELPSRTGDGSGRVPAARIDALVAIGARQRARHAPRGAATVPRGRFSRAIQIVATRPFFGNPNLDRTPVARLSIMAQARDRGLQKGQEVTKKCRADVPRGNHP